MYCIYCTSLCCTRHRFVTENGTSYNPRTVITGPYGSTSIFTGPKVSYILTFSVTYMMLYVLTHLHSTYCAVYLYHCTLFHTYMPARLYTYIIEVYVSTVAVTDCSCQPGSFILHCDFCTNSHLTGHLPFNIKHL